MLKAKYFFYIWSIVFIIIIAIIIFIITYYMRLP